MTVVSAAEQIPDLGRDEFDVVPFGMETEIRNTILSLGRKAIEATIGRLPLSVFDEDWHLHTDEDLSGHPKTAVTVGRGFVRLQTMAPLEDNRGGPDTIHAKLLEMISRLPPELQSVYLFGEELSMIQFAFLRYQAGSSLAVPANNDRAGGAIAAPRSFRFPRDHGHRDTLPKQAVVISEQLAGPPANVEIINSQGDSFTFEHKTGSRFRTRSGGFDGTSSEGRPWHNVTSGAGAARYTALFAYSKNQSIAR